MRHTTLAELGEVAKVHPEEKCARPMSRAERLARWAELLDRHAGERLATLHGTEYHSGQTRDAMRADGSPISVAFSDPVLRAEGLGGDSYGDAKRFFEVTDWQLHDILCHCHYGKDVSAATSAQRVRAAMVGAPGVVDRFRHLFGT
ncbi:MAG TPA: hypothetical protein VFK86_01815 [Bauldia sp.]|nr:hypothetical protein [Bauldia sp.]